MVRGFLASLVCALAVLAFGVFLLVSWFGHLEYPR